MDGDDEEVVYCICRSSDSSRFMICCDNCNEWYHGDCIQITEERANRILKFYCAQCREMNPELEIKFKKAKRPLPVSKPERINEISARNRRSRRKDVLTVNEAVKQCLGPGCTKAARKDSKYCSDDCGLKLATNRIVELLPNRVQQWQSTGSSADVFSRKELDAIRAEQQEAKRCLEILDEKQRELHLMITESKKLTPKEDEIDENETDNELVIYCVTCGHEVASRNAMRHMERCFIKYESQTSFVSVNKTKVEGVFCEFLNSAQGTYCMRLRVLCPEHYREPKIPDDEVCGCPLSTNCFEFTGEFCRVPKKKCTKHYCWEKLRRAQLDMEKVQKWLKLEELYEKECKITYTMSNRGSVLGLLLHNTVISDP